METVIPPDDSSTINRPDDFELIALMELLSFEDIAFTSINYYLSTMFHSEEPPPPLFISSTGNRRLFINYQGPVDNREPHDVVFKFAHQIHAVAVSASDRIRRMQAFTYRNIHAFIIERIISPQPKPQINVIEGQIEWRIPSPEIKYQSRLSISDNWKPGALNYVKQVINRYQHTRCANYHE
ncbi:hypothetical protein [Lonsdalea iberica]|uniref:Uncharacterized protein n=2 Tax=Lonsdalea iberica TaxID=1082703 RepID=A0A1X3RZB9_9GAMM|nr:hypothetical protein [Lonsdalea iberica]OSN07439.1 hypothetical protein AU511_04035 [Lonsdalea iberica]